MTSILWYIENELVKQIGVEFWLIVMLNQRSVMHFVVGTGLDVLSNYLTNISSIVLSQHGFGVHSICSQI